MKRSFFILSAMLIALVAISQTTYYKGEWLRTGTTYNYSGFIKLTITDNQAKAEVIWKLISPDKMNQDDYEFMKDKVGLSAIEILSGSFDAKTRDLNMRGYDKIDPNDIIDEDIYILKISSDNKVIFGKTSAGGSDEGCLYAILQKTATAAVEYAALIKKVK